MPRQKEIDRWLLGAALVTAVLGVVVVGSASGPLAREYYHLPETDFAVRQFIAVCLGLAGMLAATLVPLERITRTRIAAPLLLINWAALALALLQSPVAGTHRWVRLAGVSFQPSALAKITLPLALAALLARPRGRGEDAPRDFRPALAAAAITVGLVLIGPDLGSSVLLLATAMSVLLLAELPWRTIALVAGVALLAFIAAIAVNPYMLKRLSDFFGKTSYHVHQSLIAIGDGGLLGLGPGKSLQKLFFLPQPHSDFIFSVVGEELGLIGALVVIALLAVIVTRGFIAARHAHSHACALLAGGLATSLSVQALLNVSVCLDLIPAKGLPLPLVSAGGSDVAMNLVGIGLLLNVGKEGS
ncbi:MAG: FtsW/RodA/SpoVE family cell cycle protein [Acidobacteriota bacterium]